MAEDMPEYLPEETRLRGLRDLVVLDSEPEPVFDSIARLASEVCGTPIALLSLVDEQRQWFKANVGLPGVNETPRDVAFCAHAIHSPDLFEVPDATLDARFASNPLVSGAPDIRFYAGAPVSTPGGERVGTLCVIDREPRALDAGQSKTLGALAGIASEALAMRRDLILKSLHIRTDYERRMEASEARHRSLVEGQSELVSLAERDGTLVYVGPAYARHFELSPEEMIGANLLDFVSEADRNDVLALVQEVVDTGRPSGGENRMISADGAELWVSWTNSVQIEPSGRRLLRSIGRDVTQARRVDEELRASRSLLDRTGRLAGVGGWRLDLASGRLSWSEQTRVIHEVDEAYVPDVAHAIEFYAPEARAAIEAAVQACAQHGTAWDLELPIVTAKGRRIWARAQGEAELTNGVATGLVGAFADITERKVLELRLAESERFIRRITDSLPVGISYVDTELRFRFVNQEHTRRFGKSRAEILGHTREELTGRPYAPVTAAFVASALAGTSQRFEAEEPSGAGIRLVEHQVMPDVMDDGSVRGLFVVSSDITERAAAEKRLRELTAILENTPDYVAQTDAKGAVTYMNPAARLFCGLSPDEPLAGYFTADFHTDESNELFAREVVPTVLARGVWSGEAHVRGGGARQAPVSHMVIGHRGANGRIERFSAIMRDISQAVESRLALQMQTDTLRAVIEAIPAMVAVVGPAGMVSMVNSAYERWTGVSRESAVGLPLAESLGPATGTGGSNWLERALRGETASYVREAALPGGTRHVAGTYSPLRPDGGAGRGFILVAQDDTDRKSEGARLLELARRDPLTGLLNRAGFEEEAERLVAEGGANLALLCVDLDHFKPVNDTYGHPVGDAVLREFARRASVVVRPTDVVARLGGDEFAILLPGVAAESSARKVAAKVVAAAADLFEVGKLRISIGASVGVSLGSGVAGWEGLFQRADAMLYRAKQAGRGTHATE